MIAVIKTGGKQYLVKEGDVLVVEKIDAEPGKEISFDVLLKADGANVDIGAPLLQTKVTGEVVAHGRGKKIEVVHYKPKVRYTRRRGHRQPFTKIKIKSFG